MKPFKHFPCAGTPLCLAALALLALAGCAPAPTKPETQAAFYPAPPEAPRIQHLATLATERDLKPAGSGLAEFVLGETPSELLRRPYGVALHAGQVMVADTRAPGLAIFDFNTRQFTVQSGSGDGRLRQPVNVAILADGTRYVADATRREVVVYRGDGSFVTAFGKPGQFRPVDVAVAGEKLYVVDIDEHEVEVLDRNTGELLTKFGGAGSGEGQLYHPTNLAIGPDGDVFVTETSNFRVSRFHPDGTFVRSYGQAGQSPGSFARPKGIAIDREGRMYVADAAFQNVQVFDRYGRVLMAFGQPGDGSQGLNLPAGVAIDYDNVALFADRAAPGFVVEYLVLVVSQFGPNQVDVFGYGRMQGKDYPPDPPPPDEES